MEISEILVQIKTSNRDSSIDEISEILVQIKYSKNDYRLRSRRNTSEMS